MKYLFPILLLILTPLFVLGQSGLEKSVFEDYVAAIRQYQKLPMQLELEIKSTANIVTATSDTLTANALFFISRSLLYAKIGDIEQLATDSFSLVISRQNQRMILQRQKNFLHQTSSFNSLFPKEESFEHLRAGYQFNSETKNGVKIIYKASRESVTFSTVPKEVVEMHVDLKSGRIVKMITINRKLALMDKADFEVASKHVTEDKVIQQNGQNGVIKETITEVVYKSFRNDENIVEPVKVRERITKVGNQFVLAKGYENYHLTLF